MHPPNFPATTPEIKQNIAKYKFRKHVDSYTKTHNRRWHDLPFYPEGNRAGRLASQTRRYVHCLSPLTYLLLIQVGRWPSSKDLQHGKMAIAKSMGIRSAYQHEWGGREIAPRTWHHRRAHCQRTQPRSLLASASCAKIDSSSRRNISQVTQ